MAGLALGFEACVRTRSVAATCRRCVDACPTQAIALDGPRDSVSVSLPACIDCGLCAATCPTEAFTPAFDLAALIAQPPGSVTCGEEAPCVGALATEDLVVLALAAGGLTLAAVDSCPAHSTGHGAAAARAAEANALLEALGLAPRVTWVELHRPTAVADAEVPGAPASPGRRALLRALVGATEPPATLRLDVAALRPALLRSVDVPARRRRLLDALATLPLDVPPRALPAAAVACSSDKRLDVDTCTACYLCVTVCPSGALTTSRGRDEVRFDASRCLACRACHDVCAPGSLALAATFPVGDLAPGPARTLARLPVRPCGECGVFFKAAAGEATCRSCRDLEDEARELTGLR